MEVTSQTLAEVKELYQQMVGRPAPEISADDLYAFPPGVNPGEFAAREVQDLKWMAMQMTGVPRMGAWIPKADCLVTDDSYFLRLEVPGFSREDLKVLRIRNECVVRGERKPPERSLRPVSLERVWGPFERRFVLPAASAGELKARYQDGILEVRIPLAESAPDAETKTIKVE